MSTVQPPPRRRPQQEVDRKNETPTKLRSNVALTEKATPIMHKTALSRRNQPVPVPEGVTPSPSPSASTRRDSDPFLTEGPSVQQDDTHRMEGTQNLIFPNAPGLALVPSALGPPQHQHHQQPPPLPSQSHEAHELRHERGSNRSPVPPPALNLTAPSLQEQSALPPRAANQEVNLAALQQSEGTEGHQPYRPPSAQQQSHPLAQQYHYGTFQNQQITSDNGIGGGVYGHPYGGQFYSQYGAPSQYHPFHPQQQHSIYPTQPQEQQQQRQPTVGLSLPPSPALQHVPLVHPPPQQQQQQPTVGLLLSSSEAPQHMQLHHPSRQQQEQPAMPSQLPPSPMLLSTALAQPPSLSITPSTPAAPLPTRAVPAAIPPPAAKAAAEVTTSGAGDEGPGAGDVGSGAGDVGSGARDVGSGAGDVGSGAGDVVSSAGDVRSDAEDVVPGAEDEFVGYSEDWEDTPKKTRVLKKHEERIEQEPHSIPRFCAKKYFKLSDPKSVTPGENPWNDFQSAFKVPSFRVEELARADLTEAFDEAGKHKDPFVRNAEKSRVERRCYEAFKAYYLEDDKYKDILAALREIKELVRMEKGERVNVREKNVEKTFGKIGNRMHAAAKSLGCDAVMIITGTQILQDSGLALIISTPRLKGFFEDICRADEDTFKGHVMAYACSIFSKNKSDEIVAHAWGDGGLEPLEDSEMSDGTSKQLAIRRRTTQHHGDVEISDPDDPVVTQLRDELKWAWGDAGGVLKGTKWPWGKLLMLMGIEHIVADVWPFNVPTPVQTGASKGLAILSGVSLDILLEAVRAANRGPPEKRFFKPISSQVWKRDYMSGLKPLISTTKCPQGRRRLTFISGNSKSDPPSDNDNDNDNDNGDNNAPSPPSENPHDGNSDPGNSKAASLTPPPVRTRAKTVAKAKEVQPKEKGKGKMKVDDASNEKTKLKPQPKPKSKSKTKPKAAIVNDDDDVLEISSDEPSPKKPTLPTKPTYVASGSDSDPDVSSTSADLKRKAIPDESNVTRRTKSRMSPAPQSVASTSDVPARPQPRAKVNLALSRMKQMGISSPLTPLNTSMVSSPSSPPSSPSSAHLLTPTPASRDKTAEEPTKSKQFPRPNIGKGPANFGLLLPTASRTASSRSTSPAAASADATPRANTGPSVAPTDRREVRVSSEAAAAAGGSLASTLPVATSHAAAVTPAVLPVPAGSHPAATAAPESVASAVPAMPSADTAVPPLMQTAHLQTMQQQGYMPQAATQPFWGQAPYYHPLAGYGQAPPQHYAPGFNHQVYTNQGYQHHAPQHFQQQPGPAYNTLPNFTGQGYPPTGAHPNQMFQPLQPPSQQAGPSSAREASPLPGGFLMDPHFQQRRDGHT
ncbi:hypothetical protein HWV62_18428 [Athelia sp. TMB]|nr:hypothetical protein HWV62_18428 [Athelia sp. TMB]